MIPLEKQVCSLELAKRLKELGVKQESYLYWLDCFAGLQGKRAWRLTDTHEMVRIAENEKIPQEKCYSAFTVAELGEMLPVVWEDIQFKNKRAIIFDKKLFQADTEADVRAKMLIYLVENWLYRV